MKYERQTQIALDRLDQSLARLRNLIKRGENQEALRFMEEGELKEKFGFFISSFYIIINKIKTIMAYGRQLQIAMDRLDQSLASLHTMIKRGENAAAIRFMEEGGLKERYEELQNMITISRTGNYGARGVQNTRSL